MSLLERTLSEIAKPKWEGTRHFAPIWDGLRGNAQRLDWDRASREWACGLLPPMAAARVLVIDAEQVDALPSVALHDERVHLATLAELWGHISLPFPRIFIDLGGAQNLSGGDEGLLIDGALVDQDAGAVTPFFRAGNGHSMLGTYEMAETTLYAPLLAITEWDAEEKAAMSYSTGFATERVMAVLTWLESENVEIADQPVTRQVRRNAARNGREIAKVVRVKLPKARRRPQTTGGTRTYSHRFEVRGHYMHFAPGTRMADSAPEKLSWFPEKQAYLRRIWCPPHVKGPLDKPLIPKTRHLVAA